MRWGQGEIPFGRPVHWLVGLLDGEVVPFEFAGIKAARISRGHRFLSNDSIELSNSSDYVKILAKHHVIVDPKEREQKMRALLHKAASDHSATLIEDEFLVGE